MVTEVPLSKRSYFFKIRSHAEIGIIKVDESVHEVQHWLHTIVKTKRLVSIFEVLTGAKGKHLDFCVFDSYKRTLASWTNGHLINESLPRIDVPSMSTWSLCIEIDVKNGTASWTFPSKDTGEEEEWESALPQNGPLVLVYTSRAKACSIALRNTEP